MSGTTINPYRFGGQLGYRRDGTNRNYVRARHLDTGQGLWLSRDPIFSGTKFYWHVRTEDLYGYGFNNPLKYRDPSGLAPATPQGCCCCATSLSFSPKVSPIVDFYPNDILVIGHNVTVQANANFHKIKTHEDDGNCTLEWLEKSDNFPKGLGTNNAWHNQVTNPRVIFFNPWLTGRKPCPGPYNYPFKDTPQLANQTSTSPPRPEPSIERTLCQRIVLHSAHNCQCSQKSITLTGEQVLQITNYKVVKQVYTPGVTGGYCKYP